MGNRKRDFEGVQTKVRMRSRSRVEIVRVISVRKKGLGSCDWVGTRWKFGDVKWDLRYRDRKHLVEHSIVDWRDTKVTSPNNVDAQWQSSATQSRYFRAQISLTSNMLCFVLSYLTCKSLPPNFLCILKLLHSVASVNQCSRRFSRAEQTHMLLSHVLSLCRSTCHSVQPIEREVWNERVGISLGKFSSLAFPEAWSR